MYTADLYPYLEIASYITHKNRGKFESNFSKSSKSNIKFRLGFIPNGCHNKCQIFDNTLLVKFMFSKKTTKIDKIFTVDLTLCSKCQIDGEDFVNFCGLPRKHELYVFRPRNQRAWF